MIFSLKLTVVGWDGVRNGMYELEGEILGVTQRNLLDMALLVEAYAKDYSPVLTGRLRSSIGHFDPSLLVEKTPDVNSEDAIWRDGGSFIEIGTRVPYAGIVHGRDPFMESALRQSLHEIQAIAKASVAQGFNSAFGKNIIKTVKTIIRRVKKRG